MNIKQHIELAGGALLTMLDAENDYLPTNGYEVAHDLGRWWDAVLRLEETIGFVIPAELESASLRNLQRLTNNTDCLLMVDKINPHNYRETMLAFGGLARRRNSVWAREAGMKLVSSMNRCLTEYGYFDFTRLGSWGMFSFTEDPSHTEEKRDGWFDGTATSGRCLEAIIWFYEITKEPMAFDVARRIAEYHLNNSVNHDGSIRAEISNAENVGHNHSYHGTLRGLLLFGLLTGQQEYVDAVEATYRHADHQRIVMDSGWAPHDLGKLRFPNKYGDPVTDPASTGDAAQIALWLALHAGCTDLLDDVERLVRCRIIPSQCLDESFKNIEKPRCEYGAWAIHGSSHGEKGCTPDVLAAVTHTLCDIYNHICVKNSPGIQVNLHFDYENADVKIVSRRNDKHELSVIVKRPDNILIRVPKWTPDESVTISIDGKLIPLTKMGDFAWISREMLTENCKIVLCCDLPVKYTEEVMPSGRKYRLKWRGDEITGISPQEENMPFYPYLCEE